MFSEILRGVGRKRLDGSRQKGGIKVHALMDAFSGVTEFVRMTAAKENDVKFLYKLKLPAGSWIVFDKGYTAYRQFARWTRKRQAKGVLKEQYITVAVKVNGIVTERLKLRRIMFKTGG